MEPGGTRDEHYDLVSVLYHALHGADNCDTYLMDAEDSGREDLASFFREARETQATLAEKAKELLGITPGVDEGPEGNAGSQAPPEIAGLGKGIAPPGEEVPPDAPRADDIPSRTGDAPPSPSEVPPPSS